MVAWQGNPPKIPWFRFRITVVCTNILLPRSFSGEFLRKHAKCHQFFHRIRKSNKTTLGFMEHVNLLTCIGFFHTLGDVFCLDVRNSYKQQTSIGFVVYLRTLGFATACPFSGGFKHLWALTNRNPSIFVMLKEDIHCKPCEWWLIAVFQNTPPKTSVEPQNGGLEDVFPFHNSGFQVLC